MNDNESIDTDINEILQNVYVSSQIGLLNIHTLPQANKSSKLNGMNMSVYNGDANGEFFHMNSFTGSVINNYNYNYYTEKRDEISTNIYLRENNEFPDGVYIDNMLPASSPNKYLNMEYNS